MCKTTLRIEIRGKKGRRVPVLLTEEMRRAVDMLIQLRKKPEISPKAKYIFVRPLAAKTPFFGNHGNVKFVITQVSAMQGNQSFLRQLDCENNLPLCVRSGLSVSLIKIYVINLHGT